MGSYGVGVSRLVGAIIEAFHDDKGIVWPKEVTPFMINIINLNVENEDCNNFSNKIYEFCNKLCIDVLYDDTKESAGSKLATADLIGLPYQIIIGPKGTKNDIFDVKIRKSNEVLNMKFEQVLNFIKQSKN